MHASTATMPQPLEAPRTDECLRAFKTIRHKQGIINFAMAIIIRNGALSFNLLYLSEYVQFDGQYVHLC